MLPWPANSVLQSTLRRKSEMVPRMTQPIASLAIFLVTFFFAAVSYSAEPKPEETEVWEPVPALVKPGTNPGDAPADAIVLFDGTSADAWESVNGGNAKWTVANGALTVLPGSGDIRTKERFGDVQLHIEWRTPILPPEKKGQDRGNSGVFLQELYEVQVLDSLENRTYSNGQAGSIYKQFIPLVNAARPAGQWQTYDIVFRAPRFATDGSLESPATLTVFLNGVLIQNNVELKGSTVYIGAPTYTAHGEAGIRLQDHDHLVSFRNIWVRKL